MNREPVLVARQLFRSYTDGEQSTAVLSGTDFTLHKSECVAIIGSSGCGKSTLLHILGCLDHADSGILTIAGRDLSTLNNRELSHWRSGHISFVFQNHHLLKEFSALENVALPLMLGKYRRREALKRAESLLQRVGLAHRLNHRPGQLSGGEKQRAAVAQALVGEPTCVLLDEPTGNLDEENSRIVIELVRELNRELEVAVVIATHDRQLLHDCDRTLLLAEGKLQPWEQA